MISHSHNGTQRRLAMLCSVPLAFSLIFFGVSVIAEKTDIRLLDIRNLSSSLNQLRALATDAESAERAFLLTGEERYLVPFNQASSMLPNQISICLSYAEDDLALKPRLVEVTSLAQQQFQKARAVFDAQQNQGFAAAVALSNSPDAEAVMTRLRTRSAELQNLLDQQESRYTDKERGIKRWTFVFFALGTLIMIIVLVWLYYELLSYLKARDAAHAELRAVNTELEARVAERTRDLTRANEELQQFAYVASHDLQEPLRTITSFSQLLMTRYRDRLDADADEFIGYIVSSSRRMTDLINGLLALARLRKAGQPTSPVNFRDLLSEAEVSLQAAIRDSGAQITCGPLPSLVVDQVQFTQVLQNLISNAIKYRREQTPVIRVEATRENGTWMFSVTDNGIGFDQQFAERIFGLFQRLNPREVDGTGMGLSISRKIVERHGGRMWAQSSPGAGSTFFFSLPTSLEVDHPGSAAHSSTLSAEASSAIRS